MNLERLAPCLEDTLLSTPNRRANPKIDKVIAKEFRLFKTDLVPYALTKLHSCSFTVIIHHNGLIFSPILFCIVNHLIHHITDGTTSQPHRQRPARPQLTQNSSQPQHNCYKTPSTIQMQHGNR